MEKTAFVIAHVGNPELDEVYTDIIAPTLVKAGFDPKRVDKHNDGELINNKIIEFILEADLIVADLTNERPNCYLEVGYAMGAGKNRNLILTAREDHYHRNPNYNPEGPRIHFDLEGYDILFWSPKRTDEFASELLKRVNRRTYILQPATTRELDSWFEENKDSALEGLKKK